MVQSRSLLTITNNDYSTILSSLNIPTLSSRQIDVDFRFIQGLLDESIDAPGPSFLYYFLISPIPQGIIHFSVSLLTPRLMATIIRCTVCFAVPIMPLVHSKFYLTINLLSVIYLYVIFIFYWSTSFCWNCVYQCSILCCYQAIQLIMYVSNSVTM